MLIIWFMAVGIALSLLLYIVNIAQYSINRQYSSSSLLVTTYECGFIAIANQPRHKHSISYYIIALLYVIFDLEVALMLPAIANIAYIGSTGLQLMLLVLTLLSICFVYELQLGVFNKHS